jgi:hypothetical protein
MPDKPTRRQLLKIGMGAAGVSWGIHSLGPSALAAQVPKNARASLADRAARYRRLILDVAKGPGGMIVAFVSFDTRAPLQEGAEHPRCLVQDLEDAWGEFTPQPTAAEWYYGENTLWATGWLLWSQILRYRVTKEIEALETARKCFRDLSNVFRLCRQIEPGLLGKPHGGRAGPTTSYDQAANPVIFYTMYALELGTPEEKAEAADNMALHGEYYLRRNWVMNHHGNLQRIVDPAHTSTMKYLACVYAAYQMTGETSYREAAFKYLRQIIQNGKLPWPSNPYEVNHNLYYWGLLCDFWNKTEIASEFDWLKCIREYWQAAQKSFDAEGLVTFGHYDTVNRTFTPYPSKWLTHEDSKDWPTQAPRKAGRSWISPTSLGNRSLNCALLAALALLARSHGLDKDAHLAAARILQRMDESTLRWRWWDDGKLPPELKPSLNLFAPEVPAAWLVAYWMGRLQKVW